MPIPTPRIAISRFLLPHSSRYSVGLFGGYCCFRAHQEASKGVQPSKARKADAKRWRNYWNSVPSFELEDDVLQEIADYGLYKQAITHPPRGKACSLQGAFIEGNQLPKWSNDYHFNVNVEQIYSATFATRRTAYLTPLWKMLES